MPILPRGITTTYSGYDGLNRPAGKSYSDGVTPSVQYYYDYPSDVKGTLYAVISGSNGTIYTHDKFGRVTGSSQTTAGLAGAVAMSYGYSLTDQLTSMTYPSGRVVTYGLDTAGRVSSAASSTTYASNITYAPHGGVSGLLLGNGLTQTYTYNDRFQQTGVAAGALLSLNMYPCDSGQVSCAGNTGNIWRQSIAVGGAVQAVQEYRYDSLNRLSLAAERAGTAGFAPSCPDGSSVWCQSYSYDTAGNRTISQQSGGSATPWDAPGFSASTNRVSGWTYDNAGNTLANGSGETLTYDAENRQTAFCAPGGVCTYYVYDGEGQRVRRQNPDGTQTVYVYDAFGSLAAEYSAGAPAASGTQYVMGDHLDSARLVMTGTQASERHDYLPFGYETAAGGWRLGGGIQGYGTDTLRQKFTGQERDNESSLDYFHARYYSPAQGRFVSVDPGNAGADPADPQSWNGYAYVSNNPLTYADPGGMFIEAAGPGSAAGPAGTIIGALIDLGELFGALFGLFGGGGSHPTFSTTVWANPVQTTTWFDSGVGDEGGDIDPDVLPLLGLGFQASGRRPPAGYQACPAVPFVITGIGPRQAPGRGAFSGRPPTVGQVAIEPRNFGIPYDTMAERNAAQGRAVASVVRRIRIYPNFGTNTAPLPRGTPQTPRGLPSGGPYSPADTISPRPSGNAIDLYRYGSMRNANASTRITMPTIFIPVNNVGVRCPQ